MLKQHPILVLMIILLAVSLACSQATPVPPLDSNALNTSIAQTIAARQTEAILTNPSTATRTSTPSTPTLTFEPTLTVTPDFNFTPTLETPLITVSLDTNCRTGPGAVFQRVGILLVGETAEVVGREPRGEYWYIRNPDEDPEYCWVWGEYATLTGNLLPLLFVSPPPPPDASFTATFVRMETCAKTWWPEFRLTNSSGALFQSVSLIVRDTDTVTVGNLTANGFTNRDGCDATETVESIIPGASLTISAPPFGYNPAGHNLNAKITVCTDPDQTGLCLTQEINFVP